MAFRKPGRGIHMPLADLVAGVFVFVVGLILYFWAVPFHISESFSAREGIGPKTFPSAFSLLTAGLGVFLALKGHWEIRHHKTGDLVEFSPIALVILGIGLLFSFFLVWGGFLLVNTLSMFVLFKVFGGKKGWQGLLLGFGVTVCLYLFFSTYLDLAIPWGGLFES